MSSDNQDDYFWLFSDEARPLLEQCRQMSLEHVNVVRIARTLRKTTTPPRSALVMELTRIRLRAKRKFTRAHEMFLTQRGYEQSTGESIARFKAIRFNGMAEVVDICCGIGGDLIALAARDGAERTVAVDQDSLCCLMAGENARLFGNHDVSVVAAPFQEFDASQFDAVHIDPDRRVDGRAVNPETIEPSLNSILQRYSGKNIAVKLAPATQFDSAEAKQIYAKGSTQADVRFERHWIGDRRECKQQVLWTGRLAHHPDSRTATRVLDDGSFEQFHASKKLVGKKVSVTEKIGKYVFEPHATVIAARLTDAIAMERNLKRMSARIAYLTGPRPDDVGLLSMFRVIDVLPTHVRKIATRLRELDCGTLEVKHRGVEQVVADQVKRIILKGDTRLAVILTRYTNRRIAIIAQRRKLIDQTQNSGEK